MRLCLFGLAWLLCFPAFAAQTTVSFDALFTGPGQNIHDSSVSVAAATFVNVYNSTWGSWAGFAFSTVSNTVDGSWMNQYAAAQPLSTAYAVGYQSDYDGVAPEILFDVPAAPKSVRVNNTTYAAYVIRNGNDFARAFTTGDTFVLTLTARDIEGNVVATTNHYLADFRDGKTFIQTNWSTLDLSWLPPQVAAIIGTMETTDMSYGWANTPKYVALADLTYSYAGLDSGIDATNSAILCWADAVAAYAPGPNVSNQFLVAAKALGPAEESDGFNGSTNVVSLGDGGQITLTFPVPLTDGPGADFAVFENAFSEDFLEFAFVEVSSDGTNFVRFPCHTLSTNPVDAYAATGWTESAAIGGLAGKHTQGLGTPFDLRSLAGAPGLDLRRVTHVRIVDIPGDGSVTDSYGNAIFDPFPTFGSGGFDLDAVGVLNPLVEISTDPDAPAPALPGYTAVLQYKAALDDTEWTTPAPARGTPGFFRWRLEK